MSSLSGFVGLGRHRHPDDLTFRLLPRFFAVWDVLICALGWLTVRGLGW